MNSCNKKITKKIHKKIQKKKIYKKPKICNKFTIEQKLRNILKKNNYNFFFNFQKKIQKKTL